MAVTVRVRDTREIAHWQQGFLVLAIGRCQPLLPEAGVPPAIALAPEGIREVAQQYLLGMRAFHGSFPEWGQYIGMQGRLRALLRKIAHAETDSAEQERFREWARGREKADLEAYSRLLAKTFAQVATSYGANESRALYAWIEGNFVDKTKKNQWLRWSMLFPKLAKACIGTGLPNPPTPTPSAAQRIVEAIQDRFNPEAVARDEQLLVRALAIPLTPLEQQLLTDEVAEGSDDEPGVGVVAHAARVMRCERAFRLWRDLAGSLPPRDQQALVKWAQQVAGSIGMPAQLIVEPEL